MQTAIRFSERATDAIWRFNQGLKGLSGTPRAERGLNPYLSPKKEWDHPDLVPTFEVLTAAELSVRGQRRRRQRDLAAMGKKSNRKAFRQRSAQRQTEQDFRGMARVYFLGVGTPDLQENVRRAVYKMANVEVGVDLTEADHRALDEVGNLLRDIAVAYGDID